ncbi:hypothetical protein TSMEX_007714 [Taenia solium]|eukprot:TsM_000839400 transcript=TsM_000839400 gene=TsM_000839400
MCFTNPYSIAPPGMPTLTPTPVYSNILVGQPPGTVFQQPGDNVYLRLKLDDSNTVLYPVAEDSVVVTAAVTSAPAVATQAHECAFCRANFATDLDLRHHVDIAHADIRDVFCPTCQKAFCKRSVMKRHMKSVHADSKDYTCTLCNKAFAEKKNLQMHINALHKGLKPYHCQVCGKDFARKCDLLRHGNSVHKGTFRFRMRKPGVTVLLLLFTIR